MFRDDSKRDWSLLYALLVVGVVVILVGPGLLVHYERPDRERAQAKRDIMHLVTAIRHFETEYGKLPLAEVGRFEDETTQARLLKVLQGQDDTFNPRRIVFFEQRTATRGSSGIHPDTGAFRDRWGNPYRIRLANEKRGAIESPYIDDPWTPPHIPAIAWSLGKDGVQGSPGKENILKDSDDVVSWQ